MKIKLDHINLTVNDLNESVKWYKQVFNFNKVEQGINVRGQPWVIVAANDSMIAMYEDKKKLSPEGAPEREIHQIDHFGIRVDDLADWENKVKSFDLKIGYGGIVRYPNSQSWYVRDPSGHEIEVSYTEAAELAFPKQEDE